LKNQLQLQVNLALEELVNSLHKLYQVKLKILCTEEILLHLQGLEESSMYILSNMPQALIFKNKKHLSKSAEAQTYRLSNSQPQELIKWILLSLNNQDWYKNKPLLLGTMSNQSLEV